LGVKVAFFGTKVLFYGVKVKKVVFDAVFSSKK